MHKMPALMRMRNASLNLAGCLFLKMLWREKRAGMHWKKITGHPYPKIYVGVSGQQMKEVWQVMDVGFVNNSFRHASKT